MTLTFPVQSQSIQDPPIQDLPTQAQLNAPSMPTYLPITPYPVSSPPALSIAQLTDRIDICVRTHLTPTYLNSLRPSHPPLHSAPPSQPLDLQPLANAYSETCSLIWQQSLTPTPLLPCSPTASALPGPPAAKCASPLTYSLHTLTHIWATGKYHHPHAPFFRDAITLGSLQSKWQDPAIQDSLLRTTANLRQCSPYEQWLTAYPTCWSYAVGRTMHQLLQWNYRLTPATLREFLILD